ncbi:polymorphic toxin-type HINT domain-containing protein [Myceligenerans indicum]|uniref:Hint domain-containing protein n=1 Tax=Myceligenerans indicum TaxID=2593663 RepID=A0ABS1LN08_9MICO|nr:polymorphic toxin-type HINT domain-containing protein [Myceligenerans indicum]MBL0887600.1 hypothetical protein [Myceligenerans indicum]
MTGSEDVVTRYRYDGGAKWVKPTGPLTDPEEVTWSEFRGFRTVVVTTGDGSQASATTTRYLRGVDGSTFDVGPSGNRTTVADHDALAGQAVEVIGHNGTDAEQAVSWTVTKPKAPVAVATGVDGVKATRMAGTVVFGYTMDAAGQVAARSSTDTTLNAYGQVKQTADAGDLDVSGDEACTKVSYVHAGDSTLADKNMLTLVERTQTFAVSCATVSAGGASRPGDVISDGYAVYNALGQAVEKWTVDPNLDRDSGTLGDADGVGYVRAQKMTYDALGRVVSDTDLAGRTTTTSYTPATAPIATQAVTTGPDPDGAGPKTPMTTTVQFDGVTGLMESGTDPSGQTTRGVYDGMLRVFQTQDEALDTGELRQDDAATRGRQITQTFYDSAGRTWKVTSPQFATGLVSNTPVQPDLIAPAATVSSYDGAGRPVDQIFYVGNPDNHLNERWRSVTRYDGKYTTVVAPEGGVARTTVTDALGRTTALWEHKTRPTVDSDTADGHWYVPSTLPGFDPRALAPSSYRKTTYDFDRFGLMTSVSGPGGGQWTYEHDMGGRQVRATDPEAGVSTTVYDAAGNVARTVNGNGNEAGATQAVVDANTLVHSYDALGRPTQVADGAGLVRSRWTYDETPGVDGQPVKGLPSSSTRIADGLEYTTRVEGYDEALRPTATSVVLPELEGLDGLAGRTFTTSTEYRIDGSVRQQVLPAIAQLDETGAVAGTVLGKERVTTFYDDAGLPVWMGGGFGWGTYVADSQFTAKGQPQALDLGTTYGAVVAYDYEDGTERLSGIRLSREQYDGTDLELAYGYDPAGNITSITDQPTLAVGEQYAGGPIIPGAERHDNQCFDYDGLGRLIGAWTDADGTCAASIGDVTATQVGVAGGSAAPYWQEYTYDTSGNRTSLTEHVLDGSTDVVRTSYEHGGVGPNQVTKAVQAVGPQADIESAPQTTVGQYTYDASGNQTTRTLSEPVDPADPVQVEADTDGDGLLTAVQELGWDTEGELAAVSTTGEDAGGDEEVLAGQAEYVYTAGGDRLVRTDGEGTTVFLPGGQEVTVTDGAVSAVRYYSFAGQMVASRSGNGLGGVTSLVCDHQGSVMASVPNTDWTPDAVTRVYTDPFGGDRTPEVTDPDTGETVRPADELAGDRRFLGGAGGIDDSATGLVLLGARYYDTTLGRFISVDPVMDLADPGQWHGYAYANNNPVTYSDASGLFAVIGPLLDGVWVPKNSSSPAAGKQVAANNTGYTGDWHDIGETVPPVEPPPSEAEQFAKEFTEGALDYGAEMVNGMVDLAKTEWQYLKQCVSNIFNCGNFFDFNKQLFADALNPMGAIDGLLDEFNNLKDLFDSGRTAYALGRLSAIVLETLVTKGGGKAAALAIRGALKHSPHIDAADTGRRSSDDFGGSCPRPNSFDAGTFVLMADGTRKPIEDVELGDKVIATDPETGEQGPRQVIDLIRHGGPHTMVDVELSDGSQVDATDEHPFWVVSAGEWVDAIDLEIGDVVSTADGATLTIVSVDVSRYDLTAYNLTVSELHTYHVGTADVLVHNCGDEPIDFRPNTVHIFRDARGHLAEDTPENRALIQSAIDPANLRHSVTLKDGSTLEKYFRKLEDGTQAWAEVRGGVITNGGLNIVPR